LGLEPVDIASRLNISFSEGQDDLGKFVEAGIQTASGRLLLFLRYTDLRAPGTTVLADSEDDADAAREDVHALLGSE